MTHRGDASSVPNAAAWQLAENVRCGASSAEQVARAALQRIAERDPALRAWEALDAQGLLADARALDERIAGGTAVGTLAGVPVGVKDLFDTAALPTGYGSELFRGHRPAVDAQAVQRMRRADGLLAGKTVTTEFAYFHPGPTRNPWDPARTPGGSSSGSAAAVASGMVPLAFGSQTAGSLIRPASYCGIFALKPTHGIFPLEGSPAFAPSLDTLGWLARCADDLELMRAALSGEPFERLPVLAAGDLRIGLCRTSEWPQAESSMREAWDEAQQRLRRAGVRLEEAEMPEALADLASAQKTVMAYEAAASFRDFGKERLSRLSAPLQALLRDGAQVSAVALEEARALAAAGRETMRAALATCDAWLTPAAPGVAPLGLEATGDPVFSRAWTLLGLPCCAVPGLRVNGLPVGLQLVGRQGEERALLAVSAALRRALVAQVAGEHPDFAAVAP